MKQISILILLTLSLNLLADDEFCEQISASEKVDQLAGDNCDVVNKMTSCAENAIDPDAMKKRIENLFKFSEDNKDNIQKQWDRSYQKSAYAQLFNHDGNGQAVPESLLDWYTHNGKVPGIDPAQTKQAIIDQYVAFAKKHDCAPQIKHQQTVTAYPSNYRTQNVAELKAILKAPDYAAKRDEHFKQMHLKNAEKNHFSICSTAHVNTTPYRLVAVAFPPCAGNLSGLYQDNQWNASSLDSKLQNADAAGVVACINERIAKGAKIHHIAVVSSASALNNTGEAAKRFCKKGFRALSQARAESARDTILPQVFSMAGVPDNSYQSKVTLNFNGSNGDGTSGPCPYALKNGVEVLKDEFKTPAGKKELDDDKYVRINVTFEESSNKIDDGKSYVSPHYSCRNISFRCQPVTSSVK